MPAENISYSPSGDILVWQTYTNAADAVSEAYGYDLFGHRVLSVDALGNSVQKIYDFAGNVLAEWGATYPMRYGYDTQNRLVLLATTRDGTTWDETRWAHDSRSGVCLSKTYADGSVVNYTYTADKLLLRTTYASGRWTENVYDGRRQIVGTLASDGSDGITVQRDAYGRIVSESNAIASVVYSRAANGIATNELTVVGNAEIALCRVPGSNNRISSLSIADSDYELNYSYAEDGKLASVSNALAVVDYLYTADRLDAGYVITLSNGTTVHRELVRDSSRRALVTGIAASANGLEVESLDYGYDADNRPVVRNADRFGYNVRGEVTSATIGGTDSIYGYDEIGNSTNWTANCLNQYTHSTYDADGNMTQSGDWAYTYDSMNRLATVSTNSVLIVTNSYDAKSRRIRKVTPEATTTFFYDDWNLVEERIAYTNGTASTIHYYWGNDLSGTFQGSGGVGGLLYLTVDGTIYIPCYDNNGNATRYLDASGMTVACYTYDAFGNIIAQEGSVSEFFRHRFSTKYLDAESGLYYYGYRFYHSVLMRWPNMDGIEENGGANLYAFCQNSPLGCWDFLGNIAVTDIPGIMDANKWTVGASLMRHWFSLDSSVPTKPNESIVTMDWVLGYERAKVIYDKIFSEKQYVNQAAQLEIRSMIKRTLKGAEGVFCPLNRPASQVEADYVNTRQVGSVFDSTDDLMAALGRFNLRMAVSGYVKGNCAFITSVGVFVRDSYDFKGDQTLGYWDKTTNYAGKNLFRGDKVTNESFRNHAKTTGKGADYLVFSDVKITTLSKVEKVRITP